MLVDVRDILVFSHRLNFAEVKPDGASLAVKSKEDTNGEGLGGLLQRPANLRCRVAVQRI